MLETATPARENPGGRRATAIADSSAANSPRRADARPAQNPLERRAAGQPLVARIERPGDALAADDATPAETARPIRPAVPRAAADAVCSPRAVRRARHRVPAAQTAEALARRHARARSAGKVHVIGAADQSSRTRPRNPGAAPAPIRRARQNLGVDAGAAPAKGEPANDRRPDGAPQPPQHATPRPRPGKPPGQRIEPSIVHPHPSRALQGPSVWSAWPL